MVLTDTHTHLYASQFDSDRDAMLRRALDAGVSRLFLPNIDSTSIPALFRLSRNYPDNCFPMMGLHPCSVNAGYGHELQVVKHWLDKMKFFAVGEIGIDLYWDKTFLAQQQDAFAQQIVWAKERKLPIVIHSRNAFNECYEIVKELHDENLRGIFHCFSDTLAEAEKIIGLGNFWLGISGVLTFKNGGIDKVMEHVGLEHVVLETDAPYLAPAPHRGKRNESAYLTLVAKRLAEIKGVSVEEVARITTENSVKIFGI